MSENVLKKEFNPKDVSRLRNLIQGKYGDNTITGVGYAKPFVYREENDVWEEDDRKWTIKNGIKQNVTKLDEAKKTHLLPLLCPSCKSPMSPHRDRSFFNIHKMCLNCVSVMETKIRREGKWEEYEKNIHNNEIDNLIREFKLWVEDDLKDKNQSYITEAGDLEKWVGGSSTEQKEQQIQETLKYLENLKK
jgi:hypothetical protein